MREPEPGQTVAPAVLASQMFAEAVQHHRADRLDEAKGLYRQTLALQPGHAKALSNLGVIALDQGRPVDAVAWYRRAIELQPDLSAAHSNLGIALQTLGRREEALACYRRAIELDPAFADAHYNLGLVLRGQGQLDGAVASYRRALDLRPDYADAHINLGIALQQQGRLSDAVASYERAIVLRPGHADAHSNLGTALQQLGTLPAAVASYRRATSIRPNHADAHCNLALALLKGGQFAEGWAEYEWRWRTPEWAGQQRDFAQPLWRGEAAPGRTLLIHAEQGFGDTLQVCRYAAFAASKGLRVVMEVQPPLVRLLRSLAGVDVLIARGDDLPPFDLHCPMLSLPLAAGTTLATIPGPAAYLRADPAQAVMWQTRLAGTKGLRVGLAWAGLAALVSDGRRSVAPAQLAPLLEHSGVQFVSLQKGGASVPGAFPIIDVMCEMRDFADTAAVIATLDLVISVDTAVAHLAGALGKPVWLLDRFDNDWRWLTGRSDSPWYPTLRLFRQPSPGDWESVICAVAHELKSIAMIVPQHRCSLEGSLYEGS
jgi:tetratricopeptide (TPR) repeat protein